MFGVRSLLCGLEAVAQGHDTIVHAGVLRVGSEETGAHELELIAGLCVGQSLFQLAALADDNAVGVQIILVVAAHRGYRGIPYFRDIEQLKTGDQVIIRNPWERLDYRVTKIKVIDPYDMDKILIQKEKDMVTLLTCHPYRGHGRYRYVVYCMRNHGQKIRKQKEDR